VHIVRRVRILRGVGRVWGRVFCLRLVLVRGLEGVGLVLVRIIVREGGWSVSVRNVGG
jgi:hypothetical protein